MKQKLHHGFTLIELMVAIALLAIVLAIGVPSFQSLIANSAATSMANRITGSLQLARSEAVERRNPVTTCGANSARDGCASDQTDWSNGWLVIESGGSTPLRVFAPEGGSGQVEISSVSGTIQFDSTGALAAGANRTINLTMDCGSSTKSGSVVVQPAGRVQANAPEC